MKYSEASQGRVFILKLDSGEVVHSVIEKFAEEHGIKAAAVIAVGALGKGSRMTVGPEEDSARPVNPLYFVLNAAHEASGTGTIFPGEDGRPVFHMHMSCGREGKGLTGCTRAGCVVWETLEIIIFELTGSSAKKVIDRSTGFEVLDP